MGTLPFIVGLTVAMARRRYTRRKKVKKFRRVRHNFVGSIVQSVPAGVSWSSTASNMGVPEHRNFRPIWFKLNVVASQFPAVIQVRLYRFDGYDDANFPPFVVGTTPTSRVFKYKGIDNWNHGGGANLLWAVDAICADKKIKASVFCSVEVGFYVGSRFTAEGCPVVAATSTTTENVIRKGGRLVGDDGLFDEMPK